MKDGRSVCSGIQFTPSRGECRTCTDASEDRLHPDRNGYALYQYSNNPKFINADNPLGVARCKKIADSEHQRRNLERHHGNLSAFIMIIMVIVVIATAARHYFCPESNCSLELVDGKPKVTVTGLQPGGGKGKGEPSAGPELSDAADDLGSDPLGDVSPRRRVTATEAVPVPAAVPLSRVQSADGEDEEQPQSGSLSPEETEAEVARSRNPLAAEGAAPVVKMFTMTEIGGAVEDDEDLE